MGTVCYEDWTTIPDLPWNTEPSSKQLEAGLAQMRKDFAYLKTSYMNTPGFLRENDAGASGRPFFLVFGPRAIKNQVLWDSILAEVFPKMEERPKIVSLQGHSVGEGSFSWFGLRQGHTSTLQEVHGYLRDFYGNSHRELRIG